MSEPIALISGLLPPAPDGIGMYTARLAEELGPEVEVVHLPVSSGFATWFRILRRSRRSVMHVQYPSWGASWRQAVVPFLVKLAAPRAVVVTTFHEWAGMRRLMRWSALPLLWISTELIAVSRTVQAQLEQSRIRNLQRKTVTYIPMTSLMEVPAVPSPRSLADRRALLRAGGWDRVVTHFGFVYASKQPERLIEALALVNAGQRRCRLVFVGGFFQHRPERELDFRRRIDELGLTDAVELMGFIDDPVESAEIIGASDAAIAMYEDGASVRRTSLWYLAQLGTSIITTEPTLRNEFDGTALDLTDERFHVLPRNAGAEELARAIESLPLGVLPRRQAIEPPAWSAVASSHRERYSGLRSGGP
jgi:glycosyltransferase involved in cell wall biosynthesis